MWCMCQGGPSYAGIIRIRFKGCDLSSSRTKSTPGSTVTVSVLGHDGHSQGHRRGSVAQAAWVEAAKWRPDDGVAEPDLAEMAERSRRSLTGFEYRAYVLYTMGGVRQAKRKPDWFKIRINTNENYRDLKQLVRSEQLHTVCQEASCPNIHECWGTHKTAAFMILGDVCTRRCRFCDVKTGKPDPADPMEPYRVAKPAPFSNVVCGGR